MSCLICLEWIDYPALHVACPYCQRPISELEWRPIRTAPPPEPQSRGPVCLWRGTRRL